MSSQVTSVQVREAAKFAEDLWPGAFGKYVAMDLRDRAAVNTPLFMPAWLDGVIYDINRLYSEAKRAGLLSSQNPVLQSETRSNFISRFGGSGSPS